MDLHRFTRDLSFIGISHFSSPGDTFFLLCIDLNRDNLKVWSFHSNFWNPPPPTMLQGWRVVPIGLSHQFFAVSRNVRNTWLGLSGRMRARRGVSCIVLPWCLGPKWNIWNSIPNFSQKKVKNQASEMFHLTYNLHRNRPCGSFPPRIWALGRWSIACWSMPQPFRPIQRSKKASKSCDKDGQWDVDGYNRLVSKETQE